MVKYLILWGEGLDTDLQINNPVEECLDYPDFTVVALYNLCVVGCALMTPEGYITYIAVHPEWRRANIGMFMMYHLLQVHLSS